MIHRLTQLLWRYIAGGALYRTPKSLMRNIQKRRYIRNLFTFTNCQSKSNFWKGPSLQSTFVQRYIGFGRERCRKMWWLSMIDATWQEFFIRRSIYIVETHWTRDGSPAHWHVRQLHFWRPIPHWSRRACGFRRCFRQLTLHWWSCCFGSFVPLPFVGRKEKVLQAEGFFANLCHCHCDTRSWSSTHISLLSSCYCCFSCTLFWRSKREVLSNITDPQGFVSYIGFCFDRWTFCEWKFRMIFFSFIVLLKVPFLRYGDATYFNNS